MSLGASGSVELLGDAEVGLMFVLEGDLGLLVKVAVR